jgi:transcriptional regulator with XRE-family HTH domain
VYSHIRFHAEARSIMAAYLFLLLFTSLFPTCYVFYPYFSVDKPYIMPETTPESTLIRDSRSKAFWSRACSGPPKNIMATTLAPVDSREVVRCDHCHLVQFRTNNNLCRKCRTSLDEDEPEPILAEPAPVIEPPSGNHSHLQIAAAIRMLRQKSGLSQRQLALRMQVPRTYVSKIENEKAVPTLSSLQRLATALEVGVADLLKGSGRTREDEIAELMQDDFIAEVVPLLSKLDSMQRSSLLAQVRDLSIRPRRSA